VGHVGATANGQMHPLAVRRGASASLLFANADERPRRVSLRELADLGSTADLVVLSGCSTPVGGPQDYGIAPTAALAGASAVSASLWPVDDRATQLFLTTLYDVIAEAADAGCMLRTEMFTGARHGSGGSLLV
jgi:CHAT domain-containing protein